MNANRIFIPVLAPFVSGAKQFGVDIVAWYASEEGKKSGSRSRSGDRGTENNPILQGQAKAGEVAVALYCNLAPTKAVRWETGKADKGTDITTPFGLRIDVKTTLPPFKLIWSRNINDLYWKKEFDVLIAVSINERNWAQCWIEGFVTKQRFFDQKKIAGPGLGGRLEVGTWFMDKSDLNDISYLWCADRAELWA